MWNKPWGLRDGFAICGGLIAAGLMLQLAVGPVDWSVVSWPANIILMVVYLVAIGVVYALRRRIYLCEWLMHYQAAVSSLACAAVLTLIMGLTPQLSFSSGEVGVPGLSRMLSFWPFVLTYTLMTTVVGLVAVQRIVNFRIGNIGVILNHLGLFIFLVSATLGSADIQKLHMTARLGSPEWRATDEKGNIVELPIAIELSEFTIDEYPPKLMLVDNETGKVLPEGKPVHILLEDDLVDGDLLDWHISIGKKIDMAAQVATADTLNYVEWHSMGATYATLVEAENCLTHSKMTGWISCGSFMFPYKALKLDDKCSLVMPEREPRKYSSAVHVYTKAGAAFDGVIEVNKPLDVEGWDVYQLSYDESKGRWSEISIFELVRDPWLPVVYVGIVMLLAGAVCTFTIGRSRKEEEK